MDDSDQEHLPDKGLWEYSESILWVMIDSAIGVLLVLLLTTKYKWILFPIGCIAAGIFVIWRTVRWTNRHPDRRVKPRDPNTGHLPESN